MRVLVVGPHGKTGRHVVAALERRSEPVEIIGFSRTAPADGRYACRLGDLENHADRARAVEGVDAVIHYGPAFHPRETAMGTGMIDAAAAAGVRRFIYISVIHPQIDALLNHKAKLAVEAYLIDSALDWTILRPQHYMQNIDVPRVIAGGRLPTPYSLTQPLGHVDLVDLADAAATVLLEDGHSAANYDISGEENLSAEDICAIVSDIGGTPVQPLAVEPDQVVAMIAAHHPLGAYEVEALHRLFGYYGRKGIRGNAKVLSWLLQRQPGTFRDYVRRSLPGAA